MFDFNFSRAPLGFQFPYVGNINSPSPIPATTFSQVSGGINGVVPQCLVADTFTPQKQPTAIVPASTVAVRAGWMSNIHLFSDMRHPILVALPVEQQRVMQQLLDGIHRAADPCWRLDPIPVTSNNYDLTQVAPMVGFTPIPLNFMLEKLQRHPTNDLKHLGERIKTQGVALHHFLTFEPNPLAGKTQGTFQINSALQELLHQPETRGEFTQYLLANWVAEANKRVPAFEQRYDTLNFGGKDAMTTILFWRNKFVQDAQALLKKPVAHRNGEDLTKLWINTSMLRHAGMDLAIPNHMINPTDLSTAFFPQRFGGNVAMSNNHSIIEMDEVYHQLWEGSVPVYTVPNVLEQAEAAPLTMPALLTQIAPQVYESFLGLLPWSHYWWESVINTHANQANSTLLPLPTEHASGTETVKTWAKALQQQQPNFVQQLRTPDIVDETKKMPDLESKIVRDNLPSIQSNLLRGHELANQLEAAAWVQLPIQQRIAFYDALTQLTHQQVANIPTGLIQTLNTTSPSSIEHAQFLMETIDGKPVVLGEFAQ